MIEHSEPLLCTCGQHSARFDPGKGKAPVSKWMIMSVKRAGHAPQPVTSANTKDKALKHVRELCAGTHKSQGKKTSTAAAVNQSVSKPVLRGGCCPHYDDTVRESQSKPAGPGRGHKRVSEPVSAFDEAQALLKKPKPTYELLFKSPGKLTDEYRVLQNWYQKVVRERDRAYSLLVKKYAHDDDNEQEAARKINRRAVVTELVGDGYCMTGSQRTFARDKALALGAIK